MKPFENIKLSPSHVMYQYDLIGYREYDKGFNDGLVDFEKIDEPTYRDEDLKIINSCVIGRFPLANAIYNDYSLLEKMRWSSDAIDQLLESKPSKKIKKVSNSVYTINDFCEKKPYLKNKKKFTLILLGSIDDLFKIQETFSKM